jgi:hypothetical protein
MFEINDNTISITREDGKKEDWKIYFYYQNEERGKTYYLIYKDDDPDSLLVMASNDGTELTEVSEEEFAEAQEMLEAYEKDPKIQSMK